MKNRMLGLELELFLTNKGVPLQRDEWRRIVERAAARGCAPILEPYAGFPLGATCERGCFVLDNNCSVVELVAEPHATLGETLQNLKDLIAFFRAMAPGVDLNWTSQFAAPDPAEYWQRSIPSGLYAIARDQQWRHWALMNSMAVQPAIDLAAHEVGPVLRLLYLTAPVFIHAFEGNKRWGAEHSPRLDLWRTMVPNGEPRVGMPKREVRSLTDYVENLLELPAFILADGYKNGRLVYFGGDRTPSVAEAMFGEVDGRRVMGVPQLPDLQGEGLAHEPARVRGSLANFYALALPFWHARLVFEPAQTGTVDSVADLVAAIEQAPKRYVEIRHIGTPRDLGALERIYRSFIRLVESAEALAAPVDAAIGWEEARQESLLAIRAGELGENSRAVYGVLREFGVLQGDGA